MTEAPASTVDSRFSPSRESALGQLAEFVPSAGRAYAAGRNTDYGPARHGLSERDRQRDALAGA